MSRAKSSSRTAFVQEDTLPFQLRPLKVDEQRHLKSGGLEVHATSVHTHSLSSQFVDTIQRMSDSGLLACPVQSDAAEDVGPGGDRLKAAVLQLRREFVDGDEASQGIRNVGVDARL